MLKGNRKLAAVIAGLIAIVTTAALTAQLGIPENVALTSLGLIGTICGGGVLLAREE